MKSYNVIVEPQVEVEITDVCRWIARHSPVNAARWVAAIEVAVCSLDQLPQRCSVAPESESFGYEVRQLLHGQYRILFTIRENNVHVLHVRHGARAALDDTSTE